MAASLAAQRGLLRGPPGPSELRDLRSEPSFQETVTAKLLVRPAPRRLEPSRGARRVWLSQGSGCPPEEKEPDKMPKLDQATRPKRPCHSWGVLPLDFSRAQSGRISRACAGSGACSPCGTEELNLLKVTDLLPKLGLHPFGGVKILFRPSLDLSFVPAVCSAMVLTSRSPSCMKAPVHL